MLKSGCGVEQREFKTAEHLQRVVAFDLIVGWRVLASVKLGRQLPQLPATVLYTPEELWVLGAALKKQPPPGQLSPLSPREANRWVARLGGYAARANDGEPGTESLGIGLRRLHDLIWGWRLHEKSQDRGSV